MKNSNFMFTLCVATLFSTVATHAQYAGTVPSISKDKETTPVTDEAIKPIASAVMPVGGFGAVPKANPVTIKAIPTTIEPVRKVEIFDPSIGRINKKGMWESPTSGEVKLVTGPNGKKGHWESAPPWSMTMHPVWVESK